ncbi:MULTISPECIES: dTDP-4-dehydrorhamnose reductase [unclassified Guyparkeria]|uniref:dTDP-4-dehydrorhamnose reductase n=1 Tax=unclassified Guyparkeria TaxID=2626246 RepID=UPI000733A04E|nr:MULTISPECIES: dTDP-4-dehydrorhamnose reductase [unclassified Guyparkeria]KTG16279.1 dTDP-4-dehydrorhamnose reductase [Guyparkeria sp. XI15]OAE85130.1 dTDP-4-dehydrorhamnose reductase [Guyparkeria sp. WRN-7]
MTTLLFGKNGQVGTELQRTLLPHGPVVAKGSESVDLAQQNAVSECLEAVRPNVIVNAAAYTAVDKAESEEELARAINADAVRAMANYAARNDALLIHYSTDYVFDGDKDGAYLPDDSPNPQSAYGRTKLEGEEAIRGSGCHHLVFRTSWVYSANGHNFIKTMLRLAAERDELKVVADQVGAPTSAELIADVTSIALAGYRKGHLPIGTYHLTANGATSWHGLASRAIDRAIDNGRKLKLRGADVQAIGTADFPTPAARPSNSRMDSGSLEQALSLELPDWTIHVDRMVDQVTRASDK